MAVRALVLLASGVVVGVASVVVHNLTWGFPLALLAPAALLWALPARWTLRPPFALGWVLVAWYASRPRPEGDYLVSGNVRGYTLLGFGVALLAVAILTARPALPAVPPEQD